MWGVDNNKQVYHRSGTFGDVDSQGTEWEMVDGSLAEVTSHKGQIIGMTSIGHQNYIIDEARTLRKSF